MTGKTAIGLAVLVGLAVVLRVTTILAVGTADRPGEENRLIARYLRAGRGFAFTQFGVTGPTAARGPLYPMFAALLGPDNVKTLLAVNVLAGAAGVLAAYDLAGQWATTSRVAGWAAAVLFAVWPTQVYAATLTQGLCLALALMLGALACLSRGGEGAAIGGGLLGGLAALAEPLTALPLLVAALTISRRGPRCSTAAFVGVGFVVCLPWLYRNAVVFDRPMPLTSNFWSDAFTGNGDGATGELRVLPASTASGRTTDRTRFDLLAPPEFDRLKQPEPQRTLWMRGQTLAWVAGRPFRYFALCGRRLILCLGAALPIRGTAGVVTLWCHTALRLLATIGAGVVLLPRFAGPERRVILALLGGLLLIPVLTLAEVRQGVLLDVPLLLAWSLVLASPWRRAAA